MVFAESPITPSRDSGGNLKPLFANGLDLRDGIGEVDELDSLDP